MIILTSDHAGYELKEKLKKFLTKEGINFIDNGPQNDAKSDYPDYAKSASQLVLEDAQNLGFFICGTGTGMSIAANKIHGIRAANITDAKRAALAVEHNNANVICFGARFTSARNAKKIVKATLSANFAKERHLARVEKINKLEC